MLTTLPLGEWIPDQPGTGLGTATNVVPIASGYAPVKAFQAITGNLGAPCLGGGAFVASDGTATLVAGHASALVKYPGGPGAAWVGIDSFVASRRWRFAQFGDNLICSNGGQLVTYGLVSGVASAISGAPSNAIDVATVRDFVMTITGDNQVVWSEFNDSSGWTSGENQSDTQPLLDGGEGVAIVGGEYALILQKQCIRRAQYAGGDVVFQFDVISPEIGCMAQGSVAHTGRLVFFLSERGFQMCNGVEVTPIGDERFNRWFFSRFSREDIVENIWAAIDPRQSLVIWAMPGTPGTLLAYNWVLQRASMLSLDCTAILPGFTSGTSIDALDTFYPEGLDSVDVSLDDPALQGGNPLLLIVDEDVAFGTLSGSNMSAKLQLDNVEPTPGRRSRIRTIRPDTDCSTVDVSVDARMRPGDAENLVRASSMRLNGKANIRSNGRFNDIALSFAAGDTWSYVRGVEIEFEAGDGR